MRLPLLLSGLVLLALVGACTGAQQELSLESRAQKIDRSLICPVCPGETIDQSQVQLAAQMRAIVREKLQAGWTEGQVLDFFVERYGEKVLAVPPREGFNVIVWVVPPLGVLAGFLVLVLVIRAMRRHSLATVSPQAASDGEKADVPHELQPYLALVEQEMRQPGALMAEGGGPAKGESSEKQAPPHGERS